MNAEERTRFVELLKRVAAFSGVELLAYCVMTSHVHILIFVPSPIYKKASVSLEGQVCTVSFAGGWKIALHARNDAVAYRFETAFGGREKVKLGFLKEGRWRGEVFEDGVNANRDAEDYVRRTLEVDGGDEIEIRLAPGGGGWTCRFSR